MGEQNNSTEEAKNNSRARLICSSCGELLSRAEARRERKEAEATGVITPPLCDTCINEKDAIESAGVDFSDFSDADPGL